MGDGIQSSSPFHGDVGNEYNDNDDVSKLSTHFENLSSPSKVKSSEATMNLYRASSTVQLFNLQDEMLKDSDCSSRCEFTTQHALHVDLFPEALGMGYLYGGNVGGSEDTSSSSSRSSSNSTFSPLQACFGDNSLKRTYHINGAYYFTKAYIYINIYSLYPTCVLSFWLIFYEIDSCNLLLRTTARNSIIIM